MSVRQAYAAELASRGYTSDPAQLRAVDALERCASEWAVFKEKRSSPLKKLINRPDIPRGVYMHGGVGRGKSFLMDCFYNAVPLQRKTRLHFHEFMREVHRELSDLQGTVNPLDELGKRIAKRYRLICFDEFHIADITDAMILRRLLAALFDNGVGFVTTSNFHPDGLYSNGLHRDRILPAIDLLKANLDVLSVDNGTDYRRRTLEQVRLYHTPLGPQADAEMRETFQRLAESHDESPVLQIESRKIQARRKAGGVVWFDFKTLCGGPRSAMCPLCRCAWPPKRGVLPGWLMCFMTGGSSSSCRRKWLRRRCTPKVRWPMSSPGRFHGLMKCSPPSFWRLSAGMWIQH